MAAWNTNIDATKVEKKEKTMISPVVQTSLSSEIKGRYEESFKFSLSLIKSIPANN